jgi:cell division protein FtsQ
MKPRTATSRSELLRQRRSQPERQVKLPETKPVAKPVNTNVWQPVHHPAPRTIQHQSTPVSRYNSAARSIPQTAVSPRRVQYKVAANGVETRMFALPTFHFNWQWVSGILTIALIVVALVLTNLSVFQVNSLKVDGLKRLTAEDLAPVMKQYAGSIFLLDRSQVMEALSFAYPELSIKSLKTALPSTVKITVTERQPILSWTAGDSTLWVDADGVVFPPRGDAGAILYIYSNNSIPLTRTTPIPTDPLNYLNIALNRAENPLTPEEALKHMDPSVIKAALDFSTQMPEGSALVYDSVSGMGWKDARGWTVYFGTTLENMAFKQVEYQAIVERLAALGINPTTISVEYADAPYYRTE